MGYTNLTLIQVDIYLVQLTRKPITWFISIGWADTFTITAHVVSNKATDTQVTLVQKYLQYQEHLHRNSFTGVLCITICSVSSYDIQRTTVNKGTQHSHMGRRENRTNLKSFNGIKQKICMYTHTYIYKNKDLRDTSSLPRDISLYPITTCGFISCPSCFLLVVF